MSDNLSRQSILPSFTGTISGAIPAASGPAHVPRVNVSSASEPQLPSVSNSKKRRSSKMKSERPLPRSTSTPQMRDTSMSDTDADKKRNKLGYQRISIACAHCRRRKIRCLVAEGDPQQRCQNCIRLKKECVFYPVEQQSAMENRSDSTHKPGMISNPSSVVSSSPPNLGTDRPFEHQHELASFPSLPSNAPPGYPGLSLEPGRAISAQGAPVNFAASDYAFRLPDETRSTWGAPDPINGHMRHPGLTVETDANTHSPWRIHSSSAGDFAPFPVNSTTVSQSPQSANPFAFNTQRSDPIWQQSQQPLRSMSYGNVEGLHGNHTSYSTSLPSQAASLRFQPTPLHTTGANMMLQESSPHSAAMSMQQQTMNRSNHYIFHQNQAQTTAALPSHQAYGTNWYADPSTFGSLEEEPESFGSRQQG